MIYVYEDNVQKLIDSIEKRVYAITQDYKERMEKNIAPLQEALLNIRLNNKPVRVEMTEFDKIEIEQMNKALDNEQDNL